MRSSIASSPAPVAASVNSRNEASSAPTVKRRVPSRSLPNASTKLNRYSPNGSTHRNGVGAMLIVISLVTAISIHTPHAANANHSRRTGQVTGAAVSAGAPSGAGRSARRSAVSSVVSAKTP